MVGRIRSGSYGYTVGKDIGLVYLPLELAKAGVELGVEVLGKRINRSSCRNTAAVSKEGTAEGIARIVSLQT